MRLDDIKGPVPIVVRLTEETIEKISLKDLMPVEDVKGFNGKNGTLTKIVTSLSTRKGSERTTTYIVELFLHAGIKTLELTEADFYFKP